jgi:hypothetical protein
MIRGMEGWAINTRSSCNIASMKNITITLDAEAAAWARKQAAEKGMSVSRLIGQLVHDTMTHKREYELAMRRFMSKGAFDISGQSEKYPSREELYDRGRIR